MTRPNPYCLACKGTGKINAPYYSDFEPRMEDQVCGCALSHQFTTFERAIGAVIALLLLRLLIAGVS